MTNLGNDLKATVFAVDPERIFVMCPFCGQIHHHGSNGEINSVDFGSRMAHCRRGDYRLTSNEFTIRSEDLIDAKDATVLRKYRKACEMSR